MDIGRSVNPSLDIGQVCCPGVDPSSFSRRSVVDFSVFLAAFARLADRRRLHAGFGPLHPGGAQVLPLRDALHAGAVSVQDPRRLRRAPSLQRVPAGRRPQPPRHLLLQGERSDLVGAGGGPRCHFQTALLVLQGIGEPTVFLGSSVFFAIKDAVAAARSEAGLVGPFSLDAPATPERVCLACVSPFTQMVKKEPVLPSGLSHSYVSGLCSPQKHDKLALLVFSSDSRQQTRILPSLGFKHLTGSKETSK